MPPYAYCRRYAKTTPSFTDATAGGTALQGRRRLTATTDPLSDDIPVNFDGREAFPECASVIGRVRDQSDCGSCWAFASTEVVRGPIFWCCALDL